MPINTTGTWEELQARIADPEGFHELLFVNGRPYQGAITVNRYRGFGWEEGRTSDFFVFPHINVDAEVFLVDLRYLRIRRCHLMDGPRARAQYEEQRWGVLDLPEDL